MTRNPGAVQRWLLAQPERAAITRQCEIMAGIESEGRTRKDTDKTRSKRDEEDVCRIISAIDGWVNPFEDKENNLFSLNSGIVASEDIKKSLLTANNVGEKAFLSFTTDRVLNSKIDFFSPVKALKLKTFSDQLK